ncbi:MAG: winged helix-turn-helix transcriptional regulator [Anaerolineae bacterium]|nr:winged helix-turn-helix transcriptional regulator [Gemmatimonadaceae bacterium]
MHDVPDIASVARLMGDPTRARMLTALMDGRALTATELSLQGGVTPSTASSHLARLAAAGLTEIVQQGRHRYFRIASPEVAAAIEGLMSIAPRKELRTIIPGPGTDALRRARVCYDHLAGEVAVRLLERLREKKLVSGVDETLALTVNGEAWCERIGIDLVALNARRRRICRPCLDWSERRTHLGGALGAAILDRLMALRYARRVRASRMVVLSARGEAFVERLG